MEGDVVKGQPIWVVRPKRIEISSHPYPESKQLLNKHTYDIKVDIYDKDDHLIYPSKVCLTNYRLFELRVNCFVRTPGCS